MQSLVESQSHQRDTVTGMSAIHDVIGGYEAVLAMLCKMTTTADDE